VAERELEMPKFNIHYFATETPEIIQANSFVLSGEWYVFIDYDGPLAQIRANEIHRIDRLDA